MEAIFQANHSSGAVWRGWYSFPNYPVGKYNTWGRQASNVRLKVCFHSFWLYSSLAACCHASVLSWRTIISLESPVKITPSSLKLPLAMVFYYRSRKDLTFLLKTLHLHLKKPRNCGSVWNYNLTTFIKVLLLSEVTLQSSTLVRRGEERAPINPAMMKMRSHTNLTKKSQEGKNKHTTTHPPPAPLHIPTPHANQEKKRKRKFMLTSYMKTMSLYFKIIKILRK